MDSVSGPTVSSLDGGFLPPVLLQFRGVPTAKGAIGATLVALLVWFIFNGSFRKHQRLASGVPIVGGSDKQSILKNRKRFIHDGMSMLAEGYKQNKGSMFYVPSVLGERLMIPAKYVEELKTAPIDKVDFVATFQEMFEGRYTTMGSRSTLHPRVVKAQLNRHLSDVMPGVQDEIRNAFAEDFPNCDEWTPVPVVDRLTQIVARVSSRMFGGTILSENKEWIKASISFAIDGFIGAQAIKQYPHILRPIMQYTIPTLSKISEHYRAAERAAIPLLEERERTGETALDLLYWMADQAQGDEKDKTFIAGILLKVSFAAIHTSAAAPAQLIFDLCAMPEYIEPLRKELEAVLTADGEIDKNGFHKLTKMDSIMKESQRFNPLLLITFERVITEDYPLQDGFVIPAHTTIGVPTQAISMDPDFYENPEEFDGFRFEKERAKNPDNAGRQTYAASNHESMAFGFGRHACPGRFFASNEIKAIMGYLLLNYDMKFAEGQTRPQSHLFETQNLPDHEATVLFRKRR
ncbi:cytochrome P450 monooxygenase [Hypoxylon crocopeplum]|nr:cytochrome P450 monooxygenase [Hypoxylon crocopeplum]